MGKKVITMSLSEKSIQNAIRELRAYKNSLTYKCQLLAEKLAEKGVEIARVQIADLDAIFTSELISSIHSEYKGSTKGGGIWAVVAGTDHAMFVEFGWFYQDDNGDWWFTEGMPSRPFMYLTANELRQIVTQTAKEVFG